MSRPRSYRDDDLVTAVAAARSWRGVLRTLGLAATSSAAIRSVRQRADMLEIDYSHFTGQRRWTEDQLAEAVAGSRSWSQVVQALGFGWRVERDRSERTLRATGNRCGAPQDGAASA